MGEGDAPRGIFAVRADGGGLRELTTRPPFDANDFKDSSVSPDGTLVGYRGDDGPGGLFRSHVLDLRTGQDRVLPRPVWRRPRRRPCSRLTAGRSSTCARSAQQ